MLAGSGDCWWDSLSAFHHFAGGGVWITSPHCPCNSDFLTAVHWRGSPLFWPFRTLVGKEGAPAGVGVGGYKIQSWGGRRVGEVSVAHSAGYAGERCSGLAGPRCQVSGRPLSRGRQRLLCPRVLLFPWGQVPARGSLLATGVAPQGSEGSGEAGIRRVWGLLWVCSLGHRRSCWAVAPERAVWGCRQPVELAPRPGGVGPPPYGPRDGSTAAAWPRAWGAAAGGAPGMAGQGRTRPPGRREQPHERHPTAQVQQPLGPWGAGLPVRGLQPQGAGGGGRQAAPPAGSALGKSLAAIPGGLYHWATGEPKESTIAARYMWPFFQ